MKSQILADDLAKAKEKLIDKTGTEYTALINSTKDLAYWASVPDWPHRCRMCGKGQNDYGVCIDCAKIIRAETRCFSCFKKINIALHDGNDLECAVCSGKRRNGGGGSNVKGYKEGGRLSGGLRTNYYVDNNNDNLVKALEGQIL